MKKRTGILGVLIAILVMAIGYAAITAIPLVVTGTSTISPNDENFDVVFTDPLARHAYNAAGDEISYPTLASSIDSSDETQATLTVSGFKQSGEYAVFDFDIVNQSPEAIKADLLTPTITNSNTEYFSVNAEITGATLIDVNQTSTLRVTVRVLKTPATADVTSNITVTVNAEATE